MLPIQVKQWDESKIKQYNLSTELALLSDEQTLISFSQDFGKLIYSQPSAVCIPNRVQDIQTLIRYAQLEKLPITIRGNGLSQCGQSLPVPGGLTLSMQEFTKAIALEGDTVWAEANASWASVLELSLPAAKAPYVLPYNCNLSVGGVLSAGGVGASSFKYGSINAHVAALEVVDGLGNVHIVDKSSPLFHACLSGQGRFAVITKAQIQLQPVKPQVRTFCLVYADQAQWFADIEKIKDRADYLELFCSPSIQGTKLKGDKRVPIAQWLYAMHLSVGYEGDAPELADFAGDLQPWNCINTQDESIASYLLRHDSRFAVMKMLGQWELFHPWYECFVGTEVLQAHLGQLLHDLPLHYASTVHIAPVANQRADFLMFPANQSVCSFMILNPGVPAPLKDSCLQAIKDLDALLIKLGGKRYLSGYLGSDLLASYWESHFGPQFESWVGLKQQFDPAGVFCSMLHGA